MKKTVSLVLCVISILGLFTACGGGNYRDDVAVTDIITDIEAETGLTGNMIEAPDTYVQLTMQMDIENYSEYSVRMNSKGVNIDEYGIFKAKDAAQAKEISAALESYIQYLKNRWMPEYMPEERPKLDNALIETKGLYVTYMVLAPDTLSAASNIFGNTLAE